MRILIFGILFLPIVTFGADGQPPAAPGAQGPQGPQGVQEVQVDKIKQKYWTGGDEAQVSVVQNRIYSKENRLALGVAGGVIFSDPFLSLKVYQGAATYHFSEYLGLSLLYWKISTSDSNALTVLRDQGKNANVNPVKSMMGAEGLWSIMYGKLSLVGKKILYYDMHLSGGAGSTSTESGSSTTMLFGIGQRFYASQNVSVRFDYRSIVFSEQITEKVITAKLGQVTGERTNWGHSFSLGFDFMFGGAKR